MLVIFNTISHTHATKSLKRQDTIQVVHMQLDPQQLPYTPVSHMQLDPSQLPITPVAHMQLDPSLITLITLKP